MAFARRLALLLTMSRAGRLEQEIAEQIAKLSRNSVKVEAVAVAPPGGEAAAPVEHAGHSAH